MFSYASYKLRHLFRQIDSSVTHGFALTGISENIIHFNSIDFWRNIVCIVRYPNNLKLLAKIPSCDLFSILSESDEQGCTGTKNFYFSLKYLNVLLFEISVIAQVSHHFTRRLLLEVFYDVCHIGTPIASSF
jgi:hypothetical protein